MSWKLINKLTFAYVTTGSVFCIPDVIVVTVNTVVIPRATRAGAALASIQNDSQAMMTSSTVGMYTVRKYASSCRLKQK